jgi:hypothetical protein
MSKQSHPSPDALMAKMLGHEGLLRRLYPDPAQRALVVEQLINGAQIVQDRAPEGFTDSLLALAERLEK